MAVVILAWLGLTSYTLVALWPQTPASDRYSLFGWAFALHREQLLFIVMALAGALGGLIHSLRSLYWYAGNRVLRRSWLFMYFALPFAGSALALVFYLILRGGLLTGGATAGSINVFGFAATCALVGLFSPEAAEKLQQVFSTILAPAPSGRDRAVYGTRPVAESIDPDSAQPGMIVIVRGRRLSGTSAVLFHGAGALPEHVSDSEVQVHVPEGASTGRVRLAVGDQLLTVPGILHISE